MSRGNYLVHRVFYGRYLKVGLVVVWIGIFGRSGPRGQPTDSMIPAFFSSLIQGPRHRHIEALPPPRRPFDSWIAWKVVKKWKKLQKTAVKTATSENAIF